MGESLFMGGNGLRVLVLCISLVALLALVGWAAAGAIGAAAGAALAAAAHVGAYYFSHRLTLATAGARPVRADDAPELHHLVGRLAFRAGLPKPNLYLIDSDSPNAFATGRNGANAAIAVTSGSLNALSREELAGLLAHELGHVRNRDVLPATLVVAPAAAITVWAHLARWALERGGPDRTGGARSERAAAAIYRGLLAFLAPFAALVVRATISGDREYAADDAGAHILGDSLPLASALEKLEAANRVAPLGLNPAIAHQFTVTPLGSGRLADLFRTHPPSEARVERLRQMALGPAPHQDWML